MKKNIHYIINDSRNLEKLFEEQKLDKVELVLTSPPYFDVKNYNNNGSQIGYKQKYLDYLNDIANVLQQCYRISSTSATLWLVLDTVSKDSETIMLPFEINRKIRDLNGKNTWILRDIIIWNKFKNLPWCSKGRLKNQFEYILFFSKDKNYKYYIDRIRDFKDYKKWWKSYPERYNSNGKSPTNIWEFTIPIRGWGNGYQKHLCPFPFSLIERILLLSSDENDLVLDPFAGSGSVLALAKQMNRRAIGIDINSEYKIQFEKEVLLGALKYWEKRQKEILKELEELKNFTRTNKKLRKIKAGIRIKEILDNPSFSMVEKIIVFEKNNSLNEIDCYLLGKMKQLDSSSLLSLESEIKGVEKEYKVKVNLRYENLNDLADLFKLNTVLFAYSKEKIYNYEESFTLDKIIHSRNGQYLYSNIKLSL